MKMLVAAFITALLVFTLATGWMEVVQPRLDLMTLATASPSRGVNDRPLNRRSTRRVTSIEDEDEEPVNEPNTNSMAKVSRSVPTPRAETQKPDITKSRLLIQLNEVKQQESKLVAREETLRMLYDDIRAELVAVEEIRRRSASELALAERKVLETAVSKTSAGANSNDVVNPTMTVAKSRPAEAYIASVVENLANRGSLEAAATLLRGLKDREVAKILTSLNARDARLANQLFERVQAAKPETTIRR